MLKNRIRDLVPVSFQVPAKYFINAFRGQLEPELKLLRSLVKQGERAIDVGGNRGVYAYKLYRLGVRVDVFEPNPLCMSVLSAWFFGKVGVNLHSFALSDTKGEADLNIPLDSVGIEHDASATLENTDFFALRKERVALRTLDSFGFDGVGFIKIDVEGHEYSVLRGAENLLRSQRPSVLVEIEQRHCQQPISSTFGLLEELSYKGFFLDKGRLLPLRYFDLDRDQQLENFGKPNKRYINNFLFLSQEHIKNGVYADSFRIWSDK